MFLEHKERVWHAAWSPCGKILGTCGGDHTIRLWIKNENAENSYLCSQVLDGIHNRTIRAIAWSPCGNYIAAASFDATTSIWKRNSKTAGLFCFFGHFMCRVCR